MEATRLEPTDLDAVAEIHRRASPESVFSRLGADAVARFLAFHLALDEVEGWVVEDSAQPAGALLGGRFGTATSRFVRTNAPFLASRALRHPRALIRPRTAVAVRVAAASLLRPWRAPERPERVPAGSYGVLLLVVDPPAQRRGLGHALLEAAAASAHDQGFQGLHLTVNPTDETALGFYTRRGWTRLDPSGDTPTAWLIGKEVGR